LVAKMAEKITGADAEARRRADHLRGTELAEFRKRLHSGESSGSDNLHLLLLGLEPVNTAWVIKRLESGFSWRELQCLRQNMGVSTREIAEMVSIKPRTLDRRRQKGRLQPEESDRLLRLGRVFGKILELFEGDSEAAREWLYAPQRALGGAHPSEMVKTEVGAREVEALAGRMEHGVFT
jgi:putative toxin-antitoxin system antitoxin component (TIGR02293 family)